jgi:hypothetical protein
MTAPQFLQRSFLVFYYFSGWYCSKRCLIGLSIALAIVVLLVIAIAVPVILTRTSSDGK